MCGRYLTRDDMEDIYGDQLFRMLRYTPGEVFPGSQNPVISLTAGAERAQSRLALWGFSAMDGKSIINARAETAAEKPSFRQSVIASRCIVPCSGFYEWSAEKKKYIFEGTGTMFLAGLTRKEKDGEKYVIITCPANESVREVHPRMPLIMTARDSLLWLTDIRAALAFLEMPCEAQINGRVLVS